MKKSLVIILLFVAVIMSINIGNAQALVMESVPILIIDGDDNGATVNFLLGDTTPGFDFGYLDNTNLFVSLVSEGFGVHTWNGGEVVDFAIKSPTGIIYSLGADEQGNNYCTLTFAGEIAAEYSENPVVAQNYWNTVHMTWGVPTSIPGYSTVGFDVAMTMSDVHDGVAPVPEPATMLLLGPALLGLAGVRRKRG